MDQAFTEKSSPNVRLSKMDSLAACDVVSWRKIAVEWVNCLRLIRNVIIDLRDLADGDFFREVLILLFHQKLPMQDTAGIFTTLHKCLQGSYAPENLINFKLAQEGNEADILKIVLVLIGVSAFKEEAEIFRTRPAESLSTGTQNSVRSFLLIVLENKKIVGPTCFRTTNEDGSIGGMKGDRRAQAPRVLFPPKHVTQRNVRESQFAVASAVGTVSACSSPLGELFKCTGPDQANLQLMAEKDNEIAKLQNKLEFLKNLEQDSQEELTKYKNEIAKLTTSLSESTKMISALQGRINFQNEVAQHAFDASTVEEVASQQQRVAELTDQLRKGEKMLDKLEKDNYDVKSLLEQQTSVNSRQKNRIKDLERENRRVNRELHLVTEKNQEAFAEIENQSLQIRDLERYCEELREIVESDRSRRKTRLSSSATPSCQARSHERDSPGEDLARAVVDVQLKDALAEVSQLKEELSNLESEVEEERMRMRKESEVLQLELKNTESELHLREAEITTLRREIENLEEGQRAKAEAALQNKFQIEKLQEEIEEERMKMRKEREGLELKLKNTQSELHLREAEIATLRREVESLLGQIENQRDEERRRRELMAKIDSELEKQNSKYDAANERIKALNDERAVLEARFSERLEEAVQGAITKTKAEVQERYSVRFEGMKHQFKAMYSKELEEKERKVASLQDAVEALKKDRAQLRAGNIELNNMIFKLREEIETWKRKCSESSRLHPASSLKSLATCAEAVSMRQPARNEESNLARSASTLSVESTVSNSSIGSRFKAVPHGSGTLFTCDDEDGLEFNEKNLARLTAEPPSVFDLDRVQEIQRRNTFLPPHMRSCYPAEFQFLDSNVKVDEENLRVPEVYLPETFKQRTSQASARRATVQGKVPFTEITNRQHRRQ